MSNFIKEAYTDLDNMLFEKQEEIESSTTPILNYAIYGCIGLLIVIISGVVCWSVEAWLASVDWAAVVGWLWNAHNLFV